MRGSHQPTRGLQRARSDLRERRLKEALCKSLSTSKSVLHAAWCMCMVHAAWCMVHAVVVVRQTCLCKGEMVVIVWTVHLTTGACLTDSRVPHGRLPTLTHNHMPPPNPPSSRDSEAPFVVLPRPLQAAMARRRTQATSLLRKVPKTPRLTAPTTLTPNLLHPPAPLSTHERRQRRGEARVRTSSPKRPLSSATPASPPSPASEPP